MTQNDMTQRDITAGNVAASANGHAHESFLTVLQMQDALGALIRAHFQLEARLQRVLEQRVPRPEELPPLSYDHKLRLAVALGMHTRIVPALCLVGQLHDQAAQSLQAGLGDAAVDALFGVLAKPERAAVLAWHERMHTEGALREAPALHRFNLIAAVLHAALLENESPSAAAGTTEPNEVVTFEWSAPVPLSLPRRARDFASQEALYSWLLVSD